MKKSALEMQSLKKWATVAGEFKADGIACLALRRARREACQIGDGVCPDVGEPEPGGSVDSTVSDREDGNIHDAYGHTDFEIVE